MVATIFEASTEVLDHIWKQCNNMWPEWLWDVSPATIDIVRKVKAEKLKKRDRPLSFTGRKRVVVWTARPLTIGEKEMIPLDWKGYRVCIESGSQLAYENFLRRVEEAQAAE